MCAPQHAGPALVAGPSVTRNVAGYGKRDLPCHRGLRHVIVCTNCSSSLSFLSKGAYAKSMAETNRTEGGEDGGHGGGMFDVAMYEEYEESLGQKWGFECEHGYIQRMLSSCPDCVNSAYKVRAPSKNGLNQSWHCVSRQVEWWGVEVWVVPNPMWCPSSCTGKW